jgi:hypothetical protein
VPKKKTKQTKQTPKKRSKPDWVPRFLAEVSASANIKAACAAAGVGRATVYQRRDSDVEFAGLLSLALDDAVDDLELEARRRAHEGVERPVFGSGGPGVGTVEVGRIREYSDTLMIFLLKAHRPEKYRERHEVKHTGRVGVAVTAEELSDDELAAIAAGDAGPGGV